MHNLNQENDRYAFAAVGNRKDVWHALGQYVAEAQTKQAMMQLAGLGWTVEKRQLSVQGRDGAFYPVKAWGIFRRNGNGGKFLATVGEQYTPIQNETMLSWIDVLLENVDGAHWDTAGALGNGERIFASVRLAAADIEPVAGDKQQAYLIGMGSHDGSSRNRIFLAHVRPVCQNTLEAALSSNTQGKLASLSVKHTKRCVERMDNLVASAVSGVVQDAKTIENKLRCLAERKLTRESVTSILNRLWPEPKQDATEATKTRRDNLLADVLALYEVENRRNMASGTAYSLLQAVTEWTDHVSGVRITARRDGQSEAYCRAENAAIGVGAGRKQDALDVILQATGGVPGLLDSAIAQYSPSHVS